MVISTSLSQAFRRDVSNAYGVLTNAVMPCGIAANQQYQSGLEWEAEPAEELFRWVRA